MTAIAGCQQEEIQRYKAAHPEFGEYGRFRILAAIFELPEATWFFKMSGQVEWVYQHKAEFKELIESVSFKNRRGPTWELPDGWREQPGARGRYKTILAGEKEKMVELSVTELGPMGKGENTLLGNVNRWRDQLGLKPVNEEELKNLLREVKAVEQTAIVVELTGPGKAAPPPAPLPPLITFKLPPGWQEIDRVEASLFAFEVADKDKKGLATISLLGGSLIANVNRWREQVGLPHTDEQSLMKERRTIKLAGEDALYFDLAGKETKPGRGDRIIGVMLPKEERTLFIKFMGPGDLLGQQKAAFEAFVASIRFNVPGEKK